MTAAIHSILKFKKKTHRNYSHVSKSVECSTLSWIPAILHHAAFHSKVWGTGLKKTDANMVVP
jgi:hypothetical protein